MSGLETVTVVVINYKTLELTRKAIESLFEHLPEVQVLVIDNGSADASTRYLRGLVAQRPILRVIFNRENRHHGPALDQALRAARTRYALTLDSDCEVLSGDFLPAMLERFRDPLLYAVGERDEVNGFGYPAGRWRSAERKTEVFDFLLAASDLVRVLLAGTERNGPVSLPEPWEEMAGEIGRWLSRPTELVARLGERIAYVHPATMLIDRGKYLELPPFDLHGAPCLTNFTAAAAAGWKLGKVKLAGKVLHRHRGTWSRHGLALGGRTAGRHLLQTASALGEDLLRVRGSFVESFLEDAGFRPR